MKVTSSIDAYQSLLDESGCSDFFQSRAFCRILEDIGWKPLVLTAMEKNECVGGLLASTPRNIRLFKVSPTTAIVRMGPIVRHREALDVLLVSFEEAMKKLKVSKTDIITPFPCYHRIFHEKGYVLQSTGGEFSVAIDLDHSLEKLWSDTRRGCRKRIRKALQAGVRVEDVESEEQLVGLYRAYLDTARRRRFFPYPYRFFRCLWEDSLRNKSAHFFIALHKKNVIAGRIDIAYRGKVTSFISCSLKRFWNLNPNHLLVWSSIGRSKQEKADFFLLAHLPSKKSTNQGIDYYTFKTGFGGRIARERVFYHKMLFPFRYHIHSVVAKFLGPLPVYHNLLT